ncbi:MAG: hypothetical protein ABEH35_07935 [Haloarculaceae archaeon]
MTRNGTLDRILWGVFALLFAVVAVASVLPVRPVVGVFPLWAVVVLAAVIVSIAVAAGAVATGWPAEVGA